MKSYLRAPVLYRLLALLPPVVFAGLAGAPQALAATTITGGLTFAAPIGTNYFDPMAGYVPVGYGNSTSDQVPITSGIEFGYEDLANTITADFTSSVLTVTYVTRTDGYNFYMVFNPSQAGLFANVATVTNGRIMTSVSNGALILSGATISSPGTRVSTFTFGPADESSGGAAPEPATWALMIIGFGLVGFAMRKHRRGTVTISFA